MKRFSNVLSYTWHAGISSTVHRPAGSGKRVPHADITSNVSQ